MKFLIICWKAVRFTGFMFLFLQLMTPSNFTLQAQMLDQGKIVFFDDFDGSSLDTEKWKPGLHLWGTQNQGVVPENVSVHTMMDEGKTISVLDTQANGDFYKGPVKGLRKAGKEFLRTDNGRRTGGLVISRGSFGAARYEVRMKNLPLSGGCSCIWNYWDPQETGGQAGNYTEIDIEMPANGYANRTDWHHWAGFNTYYPGPENITALNIDIGKQTDGKFHIYRWDWYDGSNGSPRVEFYVDDELKATSRTNIPGSPAALWVGNWPAPWSGDFRYDSQRLYVDWVRISEIKESNQGNVPPLAAADSMKVAR